MTIRGLLSPFRKRAPDPTDVVKANGDVKCPPEHVKAGLCNICGSRAGFCNPPEAVRRESFHCLDCGSTSRDRQLVKTLGQCLGLPDPLENWPAQDKTLIETSGYRGTPTRLARTFRYLNLMFDGAAENCVRSDLSKLALQDNSLDIMLTSDVFEHVREDEPAWREVYRALKPGGYMVLQVPAIGERDRTQIRVEVRDNENVYLMEPEYHAEQTLVYRYYGNDLYPRLRAVGFALLTVRGSYPEHCISEQTVVVAQKADFVSFAPSELSDRCWT